MALISILNREDVKDLRFLHGLRDRFVELRRRYHRDGKENPCIAHWGYAYCTSQQILEDCRRMGINIDFHEANFNDVSPRMALDTLMEGIDVGASSYHDGEPRHLRYAPNEKIEKFLEGYALLCYSLARLREQPAENPKN